MIDYINVTSHEITMLLCKKLKTGDCPESEYHQTCGDCEYGEIVDIQPSGVAVEATMKEEMVRRENGLQLVRTKFVPKPQSDQELATIENEYFYLKDAIPIIIGSIIAAQAYPGRVYGTVPVPGYERVPPDQKLVRSDKFITFEGVSR